MKMIVSFLCSCSINKGLSTRISIVITVLLHYRSTVSPSDLIESLTTIMCMNKKVGLSVFRSASLPNDHLNCLFITLGIHFRLYWLVVLRSCRTMDWLSDQVVDIDIICGIWSVYFLCLEYATTSISGLNVTRRTGEEPESTETDWCSQNAKICRRWKNPRIIRTECEAIAGDCETIAGDCKPPRKPQIRIGKYPPTWRQVHDVPFITQNIRRWANSCVHL